MKTISRDQFVDYMTDVLPELISSILREDTSAVSKGRISVPQFWALHYIGRQEGLTVNELAASLNRGKSTTSSLISRLEKARLVERRRSRKDQRVVHIHLTAGGRRMVKQLTENRKQGIRRTYACLSPEERTRHKQMLDKIIGHIISTALVTALLSAPSTVMAQSTNTYTLADSIRIGLERSITVANSARQREIAEARRTGAISEAMPKITGLAYYARNYPEEIAGFENFAGKENRAVGLDATWQIFAGGRTLSAIRASRSYRMLTAFQDQRVRATQVRDIALAYYEVQLAKERVAALSSSVRQLADFEADTQMKYEAGTLSEFDWLSARVSLGNEEPRLIAAENALSLAMESFRNLTFIDDAELVLSDALEYVPVKVDLQNAIALSMKKRPDLLEKASAVELWQEDVSQQRSDYYPSVDLFANYNYVNPDPYGFFIGENDWQYQLSTGVQASWDLFDGGRRRANLAESKLNLLIAEDEYRDLERFVALDVRISWLRGRDAAEVINATTENVELARRALAIARTRFDAGLSTNLEVTQANVELSDAQLARSQALYEHMVAVTEMKYAVGILLEEYEP